MKKSDVVIFSPKTGEVLRIFDVESYNNLETVEDIFNEYDVANIEDTIYDAKLCEDRECLNKIKDFIHKEKGNYCYQVKTKGTRIDLLKYLRSELVEFSHSASGKFTMNWIDDAQKKCVANIIKKDIK